MDSDIKGNNCLFFLFQLCNISLFFLGAGVLGIGIFICYEASGISWYNGSLVGLGALTILTGILGLRSRTSSFTLTLYCLLILICFLMQTGFTLGIIFQDKFSSVTDEVSSSILKYVLAVACALLLVCFVLSCCYRKSLTSNIRVVSGNYKELKPERPTATGEPRVAKYEEIRARRNNP